MATPNYNTRIPEGFTNMNTYIFVNDAEEYIGFLKKVFEAEELNRTMDETNKIIRNCILKIGNSCFMIAQASESFMDMQTCFYLYVDNVDEVYENALANGAQVVYEPADMDYGDRQGGVLDLQGNYWWISKRLIDDAY